jgi:hypothetical protein
MARRQSINKLKERLRELGQKLREDKLDKENGNPYRLRLRVPRSPSP